MTADRLLIMCNWILEEKDVEEMEGNISGYVGYVGCKANKSMDLREDIYT